MARQFTCIEIKHHEFILQQRIFFSASAAAEGRVNVSPKDRAALRIPLTRWAEAKGEVELEEYRRAKNAFSIDGLPTGIQES